MVAKVVPLGQRYFTLKPFKTFSGITGDAGFVAYPDAALEEPVGEFF